MAQQINRTNLGFLGETYQYKLVHELMSCEPFFKDLIDIINQNAFTDPQLRMFVGMMKDYYHKVDAFPTYDTMEIVARDKSASPLQLETYLAVIDKVKNTPSDGSDYVQENATKFFRQQNIIRAAKEILEIAGNGDTAHYDKCVDLMSDAIVKGTHEDTGSTVFDNIGDTLSDDYRITIPTGVGKIDETLEGGLGKGELGVIVGPSSFGKAQSLTSRILTPSGYKLMGDMQVGDLVIGGDGKAHKVTGVFPQGKRPIYEVTFSNGTSCECDIEHLWSVNSRSQRRRKKYSAEIKKKVYNPDNSYKVLTLREIIDNGFKKCGEWNFKVPVVSPVEFEEKETPLDPYLVGYYIGDGCFSRRKISVGAEDYEETYKNLKGILLDDVSCHYREKRNIYELSIIGETGKLVSEVFDKNMKSDGKSVHSIYLFNSIEKRTALLQGLMDSDGCANTNGSCEFCSKSKELAQQVQFLVRSLGGFASITECNSSYFSHKLNKVVDCGKRYRVTITLCDPSIRLFRLERKQKNVQYRTRLATALFITGARFLREDDAQCIMVDSDEHLYITEDFIVTHNTSLTTAIASHAASEGFKVLQIIFEDRVKQIQRKHIARIVGIEAKDLSKDGFKERVREQLETYEKENPGRFEALKKNLRIVRFPSGEKTAWDIERYIKKLINNGFRPDLVIVDYFECLEHKSDDKSANEWEKEGKTMRKFEAMAGEMDMAFWVPLQGTRDSVSAELVTMDKAGGSFKKIQIAHIVMSIARSLDDIKDNKATIAILKNRAGQAGKVFNGVEFNNGTCRISTDNTEDYEDMVMFRSSQEKNQFDLTKDVWKRVANKK